MRKQNKNNKGNIKYMNEICEKMSLDLNIFKNDQMVFIGGLILFAK